MAQLPAKPLELDTHVISSSQLSPLDGVETYRKCMKYGKAVARREGKLAERRFPEYLPGMSRINAFSGLTLAPIQFNIKGLGLWRDAEKGRSQDKSDDRHRQVEKMRGAIQSSSQSNALFVAGGNDFKWFLVKEGKVPPLLKNGLLIWNKLKLREKVRFSPKKHNVIQGDGVDFLREQMKLFGGILKDTFENSGFKKVFISSIFERRSPDVEHLEIYFAYINHFLHHLIGRMNEEKRVLNSQGVPIKFYYINVSEQFFKAEEEGKMAGLFKESSGNLTHRSLPRLKEICTMFVNEISQSV